MYHLLIAMLPADTITFYENIKLGMNRIYVDYNIYTISLLNVHIYNYRINVLCIVHIQHISIYSVSIYIKECKMLMNIFHPVK